MVLSAAQAGPRLSFGSEGQTVVASLSGSRPRVQVFGGLLDQPGTELDVPAEGAIVGLDVGTNSDGEVFLVVEAENQFDGLTIVDLATGESASLGVGSNPRIVSGDDEMAIAYVVTDGALNDVVVRTVARSASGLTVGPPYAVADSANGTLPDIVHVEGGVYFVAWARQTGAFDTAAIWARFVNP